MICATPNCYWLVSGSAEGLSHLNSFDNALLEAKIGNTNLVKMSSIVPPRCELVEPMKLPQGALIPVAYSSYTSVHDGEVISSGIAIAFSEDPDHCSLIMEFSGIGSKEQIEKTVRRMAWNGMEGRGQRVKEVKSIVIEHKVKEVATTFAAVVLWWK